MEVQPLGLRITKGPRAGETLEYRPGCRIRIGRVVRGNNIAIKDAGISSKHLAVDFDLESGKWILRDLESSNGTFLNEDPVSPNKSYFLSDGDVIKIGECTSLSVELNSVAAVSKSRRNTGQRGSSRRDSVGDGALTGLMSRIDKPKAKGKVLNREVADLDLEEGLVKGYLNEEVVAVQASPRRTRSRKNVGENNLTIGPVSGRTSENHYGSKCGEKKALQGRTCAATRSIKDLDNQKEVGVSENDLVVKGAFDVSGKSIKEVKVVDSGEENVDKENLLSKELKKNGLESQVKKNASKKKCTGLRRRKKFDEEKQMGMPVDAEMLHTVEEALDEGREEREIEEILNIVEKDGNVKLDNWDVVENIIRVEPNLEEGCPDVFASRGSDAEAGSVNIRGMNGNFPENSSLPDLTKMTLREWFDLVEVHLPRQIIGETEKMIAEMRAKAVQVREYVAEQKKCKE